MSSAMVVSCGAVSRAQIEDAIGLRVALDLPAELERLGTDAELREVAGFAEHAYEVEIPDAGV